MMQQDRSLWCMSAIGAMCIVENRCTDDCPGGEKNFNLDQIMQGHLDPLIDALLELDKQQRLESL
jgi:protein subunit release factor A